MTLAPLWIAPQVEEVARRRSSVWASRRSGFTKDTARRPPIRCTTLVSFAWSAMSATRTTFSPFACPRLWAWSRGNPASSSPWPAGAVLWRWPAVLWSKRWRSTTWIQPNAARDSRRSRWTWSPPNSVPADSSGRTVATETPADRWCDSATSPGSSRASYHSATSADWRTGQESTRTWLPTTSGSGRMWGLRSRIQTECSKQKLWSLALLD